MIKKQTNPKPNQPLSCCCSTLDVHKRALLAYLHDSNRSGRWTTSQSFPQYPPVSSNCTSSLGQSSFILQMSWKHSNTHRSNLKEKKSRNIPKSNWGIFFRQQLALQRSWPNKGMCCRPLYKVRIQVCSENMKPTTAQWLWSKCHKIYMHILTTPYLKFQRLWFFIHLKTPVSAVFPSGV